VACGQAKRRIHRKRREDKVAKGQLRSNREKKKPKAEKNKKKSVIETWLSYKREREVDAIALRPHPYEFHLYYDI
jgi:glutamine synthetase